MIVLSHYQIRPLLKERDAGAATAHISPDLNLTTVEVRLAEDGVHFPSGEVLGWEVAEQIAGADNICFALEGDQLRDIRIFSEVTNWVRSLYPTASAPSMLVSGMVMHRIENMDPHRDTLNKIKALGVASGYVLDTATGLGYTAIEAAKTADRVLTVELDPASIEIARQNPWSRDLFDNPVIEQVIGHTWDVVEDTEDGLFSCIIHDPPTFSLSGELYSADFYRELYRVLKRRGRLFHYIGDPDSKTGQRVQRGVIRRLQEVGFGKVVKKPRAFGVTAYK